MGVNLNFIVCCVMCCVYNNHGQWSDNQSFFYCCTNAFIRYAAIKSDWLYSQNHIPKTGHDPVQGKMVQAGKMDGLFEIRNKTSRCSLRLLFGTDWGNLWAPPRGRTRCPLPGRSWACWADSGQWSQWRCWRSWGRGDGRVEWGEG